MKTLTQDHVLEALRTVRDPDLQKDIVALNFVKEVKIEGRDLRFTIELTTPSCPVRDELKAESEKAIRSSIADVGAIEISMTSNVTSRQALQPGPLLTGVKNTIAVASGKGGVGKSTVAVNLAVALAMDGASVGLIDCDVYGPSIPLMFNINEKPKLHNQKLQPLEKYGVKVMSIGFLVDPMQAVVWRGPMASGAVRQFMSDVEWGDLDYRYAAGNGGHSINAGAANSIDRCRHRDDASGNFTCRRPQRADDVQQSECANPRDHREHELLCLLPLRYP